MSSEVNFLRSIDQIPLNAKVVLCGAGALGVFAFELITKNRKDVKFKCFIDDVKKGEKVNLPIYTRNEFVDKQFNNEIFILITSTYWRSFLSNLNNSGIKNCWVFDLLSQGNENKITTERINSIEISQYTPNLFLELNLKNLNQIEPNTLEWINGFKNGSVFYDIGASNGIYAIYSVLKTRSRVIAIEADAQNFSLLHKNCFLNKIPPKNFTGLNIALGSRPSVLKMHSEEFVIGMHGKTVDQLGRAQNQKESSFAFNVLVESLDNLIRNYQLGKPDYLKLDVDGAEFEILKGMKQTLKDASPELLIETDDQHLNELDSFLSEYKYKRKSSYNIFEVIGGMAEGVRNHLYKK